MRVEEVERKLRINAERVGILQPIKPASDFAPQRADRPARTVLDDGRLGAGRAGCGASEALKLFFTRRERGLRVASLPRQASRGVHEARAYRARGVFARAHGV